MLVAVPDQRPVVISKVWPSHVYVRVWTFDGVVAESVALAAVTSAAFRCATAAPVATRAPSAAVISTNRFMPCHLLLEVSQSKTPEL